MKKYIVTMVIFNIVVSNVAYGVGGKNVKKVKESIKSSSSQEKFFEGKQEVEENSCGQKFLAAAAGGDKNAVYESCRRRISLTKGFYRRVEDIETLKEAMVQAERNKHSDVVDCILTHGQPLKINDLLFEWAAKNCVGAVFKLYCGEFAERAKKDARRNSWLPDILKEVVSNGDLKFAGLVSHGLCAWQCKEAEFFLLCSAIENKKNDFAKRLLKNVTFDRVDLYHTLDVKALVCCGDLEVIDLITERCAVIGKTRLCKVAIKNKKHEVFRHIFDRYGARFSSWERDYVLTSAIKAQVPVVIQLLEKETDPKSGLLLVAAKTGNLAAVKVLVRHQKVNRYIRNKFGQTALHVAAACGHEDVLAYLIKHDLGINVSDNNRKTPLHYAAQSGHQGCVTCLLDNGAQPNICDNNQETPLHYAAKNDKEKAIRCLLKNEVEFNPVDVNRRTPLFCAAMKGFCDSVRVLIDGGARCDAVDEFEKIPMHYAAEAGHKEVVQLLLEHGANPRAVDEDGNTPGMLAQEKEYKGVLSVIRDWAIKKAEEEEVGCLVCRKYVPEEKLRVACYGCLCLVCDTCSQELSDSCPKCRRAIG